MNRTIEEVIAAIQAGMEAKSTGPRGGCGRAYVVLSPTATRKEASLFKTAFTRLRMRYVPAMGRGGNRCAYIGYDNADGLALARADSIVHHLQMLGFNCYSDAVSD